MTIALTTSRTLAIASRNPGSVVRVSRDGRVTVRTAAGSLVDMLALDLPGVIGGEVRANADALAAGIAEAGVAVIRTR